MIQNVAVDAYGHVTGMTAYSLDNRYFTETEADARCVNVTGESHVAIPALQVIP
jgi:hypothetical protein